MKQPIGIIDSGVGGMSVVKTLLEYEPEMGFVYLGDQARCPYGERTKKELLQFTSEMIYYLIQQYQVSAVVIACNTISATCLNEVRQRFSLPIISIVECGIAVTREHHLKPLGIIATTKTIASHIYQQQLRDYLPQAVATPNFATYVETQTYDLTDISRALAPLQEHNLQALLLGCTHYPFLATEIAQVLPECQLLDPAVGVIQEVQQFLFPTNRQIIVTTGQESQLQQLLAKLLPEYRFSIQQTTLEPYQS